LYTEADWDYKENYATKKVLNVTDYAILENRFLGL